MFHVREPFLFIIGVTLKPSSFHRLKCLPLRHFYFKTKKTMKKISLSQRKKEKWFTSKILNIIIIVLFFEVLGGLSAKFYYYEMTDCKWCLPKKHTLIYHCQQRFKIYLQCTTEPLKRYFLLVTNLMGTSYFL